MTQKQALRTLRRKHWRNLEALIREAWQQGHEAGVARARGLGRRGRTIRADATVEGLVRRIERHFGLDRYGFEVRVVHPASGRRVPSRALLARYRDGADVRTPSRPGAARGSS
jgi:hypothetical protein